MYSQNILMSISYPRSVDSRNGFTPAMYTQLAAAYTRLDDDPQLRPQYRSLDPGSPHLLTLAVQCPPQIAAGGQDESEMGVFHTLYHPQRLDNVRGALREFLPLGWTADITLMS